MNLLFSMSLAGSLVFLVYLVLRPLTVRYFSSAWRYRLLKLVLLFYLLPYQYFKYHYYDIFCGIFFQKRYQNPAFSNGFVFYDMDKLILIDSEGNRSIKNEKIIFMVLAVWGIVVISFAIYQVAKYISCKRELRQISTISDSGFCDILDQCIKHSHIKKKVALLCCSYISTPFTIGVFFPRIILPDTLKEEKSIQMIVSHELTHVKNHDIFIKFLTLLVMVLHWYNPLTYLLYWEICRVYEYVCDETVTQAMTEEEKEKYKFLIVELAQKPSQANTLFANALSSNYKIIKERITLMDRSIISSKCMRIVSFALIVVLLVMSPLPVLAYSPMVISKWEITSNDCNFNGQMYYSNLKQDNPCIFDIYDPFLELGTEQYIFVDDSGLPNVIYETTNQIEQSICNHVWDSGRIYIHTKNNDGSCTVNIYNGQKCSRCNENIVGDLYTSMQYPKCPH